MGMIELPESHSPPTLEDQVRAAVYAASAYHQATALKIGDRLAYIVPAWMYEKAAKALLEPYSGH